MSWWNRWRDELRLDELPPAMLHLAVQLVEMGEARDRATRAVLLEAVVNSLSAQQQGSTRIPASAEVQELAAADAVPSLLGTHPSQFRPLIVVDQWLYHQRTLHYERELARRLRTRLAAVVAVPERSAAALAEVVAKPTRFGGVEVQLTDEQQRAVQLAMERPLTVVTGGPGTGKTSIVVSLIRALVRCGIAPNKIALAAPTGKAANRLGISIEAQLGSLTEVDAADAALRGRAPKDLVPVTLHRLLKYSGTLGRFRRDEDDPIDAKWVIVDEASMIDLVLMERLARCVPDGARLVLLGDVDQLPSVETGTVLRDIIGEQADAPHVARLNVSHRMDPNDAAGRAILSLARSLSEDEVTLTSVDPGVTVIDIPADEVRGQLLDFLDGWFDDKIAALPNFNQLTRRSYHLRDGEFTEDSLASLATLFGHFERYRILCLTRVFATGADAVNEAFHLRMARHAGTDGVPDYVGGEPVMMLRNDYERQLFNGDQGLVVWVEVDDEPPRLAAVFPSEHGFSAHHLSQLSGQLAHSWAMTVHKAQGSEYDEVALLLPLQDIPLLSRELLYTAITRARRSVTILGDAHLARLGAARTIVRWSGLPERISGAQN